MRTILWAGFFLAVVFIDGLRPANARENGPSEQTGRSIAVETSSGRRFLGEVDVRSDREQLWLRSTRSESSVLRPIRWDRIDAVELGEERYTGEEFLAAFQAISAVMPSSTASTPPSVIRLARTSQERLSPALEGTARQRQVETPKVQSLGIDVAVANWDGDVEVDGVVVEIRPLDAWGSLVASDGTLTVDLIGRPTGPVNRPEPPIRLGRWSLRVAIEDFGLSGAVYRFPFQALHPAFERGIAPDGLVHVRLSVSGQGVFEASACPWRLRPYCSFRDELDRATGNWWLPVERTGRGQRTVKRLADR